MRSVLPELPMRLTEATMERVDTVGLRDPATRIAIARRWIYSGSNDGLDDVSKLLAQRKMPQSAIRTSLFIGSDQPVFFELQQWSNEAERDRAWNSEQSESGRGDDIAEGLALDWHYPVSYYREFSDENGSSPRCLVTVHQPLLNPNVVTARGWIDTVLRALQAPEGAPRGLSAAAFHVSTGEWESADAHRAALKLVGFGKNGSLGDDELWRAARSYPGIDPDHQVTRYYFVKTASPDGE
jgi:hypothetical protein